jgi:hypothetical protein
MSQMNLHVYEKINEIWFLILLIFAFVIIFAHFVIILKRNCDGVKK